jgi:hypothetical protein
MDSASGAYNQNTGCKVSDASRAGGSPLVGCQLQELRGHEPERKFRLRQGGRNQIFFTTCWLFEPTCREKDQSSTVLPQANLASIGLTAWFEQSPRTSCQLSIDVEQKHQVHYAIAGTASCNTGKWYTDSQSLSEEEYG